MFTPARICLAIGLAAQAVPMMAHADKLPWWMGIALGCTGIFCQVITGVTGPVQNDSKLNAIAQQAISQAKSEGGEKPANGG